MGVLKIVDIILIVLLLVIGIETIIKFKKSDGKLIEEIREPLITRINIIMVLTVIIAVITIVNILIGK